MPPKKPLTKKELEELKKQEARKKEEEEKKKKEQEEKKQLELLRLKKIQEQNMRREQLTRLQHEAHTYKPILQKQLKRQQDELKKIGQRQKWEKFVSQMGQSPEIQGSDLTTFINQYESYQYKSNQQALTGCQHSQIIAHALGQRAVAHLSQNKISQKQQIQERICQIRHITMKKLEDIMVNLANQADSFVQQRIQYMQMIKKQAQTKKHDQKKNQDTISYKSQDIKIGVFLSSSLNRNTLKFKPAEIKQFGMNSEVPGKIMNSNLVIKFQWTNFDPYLTIPITYYPFNIIGGVYTLQFFDMVSNSKKISNWTLKTDYNGRQILDKSRIVQSKQNQSFHLTYQLPDYLYLRTIDKASIKIAGWDGSKWNIISPQTVQLDIIKKSLYFQTTKSGSFAYIQDRCLDYPYLSWQLRCVKPNVAHLDLVCKRQILKFEIGENYARLLIKDKDSQLYKFTTLDFTPQKLLYQLSLVGINLLPCDQDYATAGIVPKNKQSQEKAIRDLAYGLTAFYIRSYKHSQSNIIVKLRENLQFDEIFLQDQEKDWKKVCWWSNKCGFYERKNILTHLNLENLLAESDIIEIDCLKRMRQQNGYLMKRTLIRFLRLTRIFSFIVDK